MLQSLHIKNLALIDEIQVDFSDGLNILTGETGAGKSIIIGSIGIGLGGRFDNSLLRDRSLEGLVELIFWVDPESEKALKELDSEIAPCEGQLIIQRRLVNGRTTNRINDHSVTITKLREVAEVLINLHAQHESTTLLKPKKHLAIIDSSDPKINSLKEENSRIYKEYREVSESLEALSKAEGEMATRLDFISFEISEIESACLNEGEDTLLEEQYKKMNASRDILSVLNDIYRVTGYDDSNSAGNVISRNLPHLRDLIRFDKDIENVAEYLSNIDSLLNDFNRSLSDYMSSMEFDEADLRKTEERLDFINSLKMKYGKSIELIKATLEELKEEREKLKNHDEIVADLRKKKESLYKELEKAAEALSERRKAAAEILTEKIKESLLLLNFNDVKFSTEFKRKEEITQDGYDEVCFMISTNVGEEIKPLQDVASGGELSRVMLAIKASLTSDNDMTTLVFDEIDTGISGITAEAVGKMMKQIASKRQVICITHLAQIASVSDHSFIIEKTVTGEGTDKKTVTLIREINEEGKIMEIARLLGGAQITDNVLATAREMVKNK